MEHDSIAFYLWLIWLVVGVAILVWVHASALIWKLRHRGQSHERDLHGGNNSLMGSLVCFMWPFVIPLWLYEKIWYGKK